MGGLEKWKDSKTMRCIFNALMRKSTHILCSMNARLTRVKMSFKSVLLCKKQFESFAISAQIKFMKRKFHFIMNDKCGIDNRNDAFLGSPKLCIYQGGQDK